MKAIQLVSQHTQLKAEIHLPASKSISNRALILQAAGIQKKRNPTQLIGLSEADDTILMKTGLQQSAGELNIKNAGTCLRFLCAYYAATPGVSITLTGNTRMKERPIAPLVNTLKQLGAHITYTETENQLPIHIEGTQLKGGKVVVDASASSQFISALMLIAPLLSEDLEIELGAVAVSKPYIALTASVLQSFGYSCTCSDNFQKISVRTEANHTAPETFTIEADWSSAAFFYQAALTADHAELFFPKLNVQSLQGDAILKNWFETYGIISEATEEGLLLKKKYLKLNGEQSLDFTDYPDLAPALICALAASGIACKADGLGSLIHKESNRLEALYQTLGQLHYGVKTDHKTYLQQDGLQHAFYENEVLQTHADHRLAMAYAVLSIHLSSVKLSEIESVVKSFPHFFTELRKIGIKVI